MASLSLTFPTVSMAGSYPPAAGVQGSTAIHMDDPSFVGWATGYTDYTAGSNVDSAWQTPEKALGKATGNSYDVVSLGRAGQITLTFSIPIEDGEGWDFAVFENSFSDTFLELAYVEVSSDGTNYLRFDSDSLTAEPVGAFGSIDPTDIEGLAGKYRQGYGTPFDLADLGGTQEVLSGTVDLNHITHVRIIDIIGDGTSLDASGDIVYDPYPTVNSAGFDLDAIGISNGAAYPEEEYTPPSVPPHEGEAGFGGQGGCFIISLSKG
ncbi:MAG: PEP-CTERM sorting domain-containing protein [Deltaproteobacteria bacterium]|nr:MAG: PEP-CTERM sorting domain-containing protein [Deltaproteobacteria bacterium]